MRMDVFKKGLVKKTMKMMVFMSLAVLIMAGCSPKAMEEETKVLEAREETDKNKEAIQAVIEKEFTAPDNDYRKLREAAMSAQSEISDQEGFDALMEEPVYQDYTDYMEKVYAKHFTDNGYVNFINSAPAFMYSVYEGDYKLVPSDIEITQNEQEPTLYDFTFKVTYTNEEAETELFNFGGNSMVPEDGKIGSIQFEDQDRLQAKMSEAH